jgi:glutamine synthetase
MGRDNSGGFAARHGLWTTARRVAAERAVKLAREHELEVIRFSFADQHGVLRGKTLVIGELEAALEDGVSMTTTLLAKDTSHRSVFPVFASGGGFGMAEMGGGADMVMMPDPDSFKILPWAEATGWMLCDLYFPNGEEVLFSTRRILREALGRLAGAGYELVTGLEVELHIFKLLDAKLQPHHATHPGSAPEVELIGHGYQYLTDQRQDTIDPILTVLRRDLVALGLPLRSIEVEFGPSQVELTLSPAKGMASADAMVLLRSAVKQICRRHGLLATFMCRPGLPNLFASGWHLHQSLIASDSGANAFTPDEESEPLSQVGRWWAGGLLAHARAGAVFATPTINGYKRYRSYSLAPDRAIWGRDNRGVMIRALGGAGSAATRLENRIGEPAANPYLYLASQIDAGLDGLANRRDPGPSADVPYETEAPALPKSLMEAVAALRDSQLFRDTFGERFVDYLLAIKEAEIARFLSEVTDWEQKEYLEMF